MPDFYKSSFGDLRLWLSTVTTDKSRTLVVHEMSAGDDYVVQDRGRAPLKSTFSVLFDLMAGDDIEPLDRARRLSALVDGKPRLLSHPIEGTYLARVGPFNIDIDENGVITANVEFIAVAESIAVAPAGAGGIPAAGAGAVAQAADAYILELEGIGESGSLGTDAAAAADSWAAAADPNPRDVLAQTGSLTEDLGTQADDLDDDLAKWQAFKQTVLLSDAVRAAAEASTSDTTSTFVLKVGSTVALRALLAGVYGADECDVQYARALLLNDISNPAWLELGTELVLPMPTTPARSA